MKICKCGNKIPSTAIIDGKRRNLKNRSKCLICQPFGSSACAHSHLSNDELIKKLKLSKENYKLRKSKNYRDYYNRRKCSGTDQLWKTTDQKSTIKKAALAKLLDGCQLCNYNYNKTHNLAFHHLNNKKFSLDIRAFHHNWTVTKPELLKCILVCLHCHGDIHAGLVNQELINNKNEQLKLKLEPLTDYPI